MLSKSNLFLNLNEQKNHLKTKLLDLGFPNHIFEKNEAAEIAFFIADISHPWRLPTPDEDVLCICDDHKKAYDFAEKISFRSLLIFKNESACLYFLAQIISSYLFGAFKEYDLMDFYMEFSSNKEDIRIISCTDETDISTIPFGRTVFGSKTLESNFSSDSIAENEEKIYSRFSEKSMVSFIMPQETVHFQKLFFEDSLADSYLTKSEKLFEKWKNKESIGNIDHKNNVFIKDGIVSPKQWFQNDVRPLFLLKEAYGGESDWNLITDHLCSDRKMSKIWKRVAQWTHGILHTDHQQIEPYAKYEASTFSENKDLKNIAVINIKKSGGKTNSDWNELQEYAEYDKKELFEQLQLCDPTVIVCGYAASYLETVCGDHFRNVRNNNLFYHIQLNGHDVLVLDYWHPANQYPDMLNYYGLVNAYHFALKEKISI